MNERGVNIKTVTLGLDIRTLLKLRRKYEKAGDTQQDYMVRGLEELVKGVKLSVAEEAEASQYMKGRYDDRMYKRTIKRNLKLKLKKKGPTK